MFIIVRNFCIFITGKLFNWTMAVEWQIIVKISTSNFICKRKKKGERIINVKQR